VLLLLLEGQQVINRRERIKRARMKEGEVPSPSSWKSWFGRSIRKRERTNITRNLSGKNQHSKRRRAKGARRMDETDRTHLRKHKDGNQAKGGEKERRTQTIDQLLRFI